MKLNDIFERAARLVGISDEYFGENDAGELKKRALCAINTALFDLYEMPPAETLVEEVELSGAAAEAGVYGTAMFLSLAFGDTAKAGLFSKIYSDKRTAFKSHVTAVRDTLPKTEGTA